MLVRSAVIKAEAKPHILHYVILNPEQGIQYIVDVDLNNEDQDDLHLLLESLPRASQDDVQLTLVNHAHQTSQR